MKKRKKKAKKKAPSMCKRSNLSFLTRTLKFKKVKFDPHTGQKVDNLYQGPSDPVKLVRLK